MLSKIQSLQRLSTGWMITIVAIGWLVLISWLHWVTNFETHNRPVLRMGYMPVVTNLACPLLDYASKDGSGVRFEALKFSSFAEMGEALRNGTLQAGFMIAPLSVVLHQQGTGVRVVYIGNRHESTLVYRKDLQVKDFSDLVGKTVAVPMRFSGHNIATRQLADKYRLSSAQINIVEMNPPDMASALASGAIDAYFVGEPFAAKTVQAGEAKVLYNVEEVWPQFICNLVCVRQDVIDKHPEWVKELVQGAARSGIWASAHPLEAARIVAPYWNQPEDFVAYVLTNPPNRFVYDKYTPKEEELLFLANEMKRFQLIENPDIKGLVDDHFAKEANIEGVTDFQSILHPPAAGRKH